MYTGVKLRGQAEFRGEHTRDVRQRRAALPVGRSNSGGAAAGIADWRRKPHSAFQAAAGIGPERHGTPSHGLGAASGQCRKDGAAATAESTSFWTPPPGRDQQHSFYRVAAALAAGSWLGCFRQLGSGGQATPPQNRQQRWR